MFGFIIFSTNEFIKTKYLDCTDFFLTQFVHYLKYAVQQNTFIIITHVMHYLLINMILKIKLFTKQQNTFYK